MRFFRRLCHALPMFGVLVIVGMVPAALALSRNPPVQDAPVVVISAPWVAAEEVATRAGGQSIAPGRISAISLVWSPNPEFIDALYRAGAWVVLNGDLSGVLCVT